MFKKLCGNNNFGNVVLGLTFCDIETTDNIRSRTEELSSTPEWWGDMIARGSRVECIPHQRNACIEILSQFRPRPKFTLKIQKEVVVEARDINQTDAAKTIAHKQELTRIRAQEVKQHADLRAEYERKMKQAKETYESTLKLAQQQFEIASRRQQIQEQIFKLSNQRQEELHRKVNAMHAENEAKKEANARELVELQKQLPQVRLGVEKQRGELGYAKFQSKLRERRKRLQAEWDLIQSRKNAWRLKQPYKEYEKSVYDAETTMIYFLGTFCDRCSKSYSPFEDFSGKTPHATTGSSLTEATYPACQKCIEVDQESMDSTETGSIIYVCSNCKAKGKGCYFHGLQHLSVDRRWQLSALWDCPRYSRTNDIPWCDKCDKDLGEDSLYLRKCSSLFRVSMLTRVPRLLYV